MSEAEETEHLQRAIEIHSRICGERARLVHRPDIENTRRLVATEGGFSMTPTIIRTIFLSGAPRPRART